MREKKYIDITCDMPVIFDIMLISDFLSFVSRPDNKFNQFHYFKVSCFINKNIQKGGTLFY